MPTTLSTFIVLTITLASACAEFSEAKRSASTSQSVENQKDIRIEVYLTEATKERNCENIKPSVLDKFDLKPWLVYNSLVEFESNGFADIQIDDVIVSKKLLIFILAFDTATNAAMASACLDAIEIDRNTIRNIHVLLVALNGQEDE